MSVAIQRAAAALVLPAAAALAVLVLLALAADALAAPPRGYLEQIARPGGCVGAQPECSQPTTATGGFSSIAVSFDGRNAYALVRDDSSSGALLQLGREPSGALSQLPAPFDCVTAAGSGCGAVAARGFEHPRVIAIAPDGKHVYVSSPASQAIAAFGRRDSDGALVQLAAPDDCVGYVHGTSGCGQADANGLSSPTGIAVSPDGKHVYVAGLGAVAAFSRDATSGRLSQLAAPNDCITPHTGGCGTTRASGLPFPYTLVISPDGKHVYVASIGTRAVSAFARNGETGALTQLPAPANCLELADGSCSADSAGGSGSIHELAISPDGKHLYAIPGGGRVVTLLRDASSGALSKAPPPDDCVTGRDSGCSRTHIVGMLDPKAVSVSPDGRSVYVASPQAGERGGAVAALARDELTGGLTQLAHPYGCLSFGGTDCGTSGVAALQGAVALATSTDGNSVYTAGGTALGVLGRDPPSCNPASATATTDSDVQIALHCEDPEAEPLSLSIVRQPFFGRLGPIDPTSGGVTYTASSSTGTDGFAFVASDGALSSRPAEARVDVQAPVPDAGGSPGGELRAKEPEDPVQGGPHAQFDVELEPPPRPVLRSGGRRLRLRVSRSFCWRSPGGQLCADFAPRPTRSLPVQGTLRPRIGSLLRIDTRLRAKAVRLGGFRARKASADRTHWKLRVRRRMPRRLNLRVSYGRRGTLWFGSIRLVLRPPSRSCGLSRRGLRCGSGGGSSRR